MDKMQVSEIAVEGADRDPTLPEKMELCMGARSLLWGQDLYYEVGLVRR